MTTGFCVCTLEGEFEASIDSCGTELGLCRDGCEGSVRVSCTVGVCVVKDTATLVGVFGAS